MGIKTLLMTEDPDRVAPIIEELNSQLDIQGVYVCPGPLCALYLGTHHEPDALFIDEAFGETVVSGVIAALKHELTPTHFILLTEYEGGETAERARTWGARDYLPRTLAPKHLTRCLRNISRTTAGAVTQDSRGP